MAEQRTPDASQSSGAGMSRSTVLAVMTLCLGSLSGALMQSLVIPIQSELPSLLGTAAGNASWAVTATLLAAAVTMPVTGRLADMYGKKRILIVCAAVLIIGSVVAALATSLVPFIVGRALQGAAMGFIPVATSLVGEIVPPQHRTTAIATVSATMGVGGAVGLPLAAWIADSFNWHNLFWFSAVLAGVVLVCVVLFVPDRRPVRETGRIDVSGLIGLAVGLCGFLIGVSKGSEWGWTSDITAVCIVGGLCVLLLWGWYELHVTSPLIDLRTSAHRPILFTNIAAVLIGFGMMAQSIVVPQLLQMPEATGYGLGQSILAAGLWMAPGGLMMMLFSPVSSTMITRFGARVTLSVGAVIVSAGYVVAVLLMDAPWQLMVASIVASSGVGVAYAAMPTLIMDNTPAADAASGVGVNALMRSVGTTLAGAVMAAILTSSTIDLGGTAIPDDTAFRLCFLVGALAAVAGALVVLLVPRRRHARFGPHGNTDHAGLPVPVEN